MPQCIQCGNQKGVFEMGGGGVCKKCRTQEVEEAAKVDTKAVAQSEAEIFEKSKKVVLTTAFSVAGREIDREIDIIAAECALGMNIFKDIMANARDLVGGRSGVTQKALRDGRQIVMAELRKEAVRVGADAVIGIDLDYLEAGTGSATNMFLISANGTAVKFK